MLVILDVNETLLDVSALDSLIAEIAGGEGSAPRRAWFDQLVRSALTVTAAGQYVSFGALAGAALRDTAAANGRSITAEHTSRLADGIRNLPAHPDVTPALRRLRAHGHRIVTLTNSVLDVADAQLVSSGLDQLVDAVYSADEAGRLKPAPEPYRMVLERERADTAVLVAAHDWDVAGAAAAGLDTAFVGREQRRPFSATAAPTYIAEDLNDLAEQLTTQPRRRAWQSLVTSGK